MEQTVLAAGVCTDSNFLVDTLLKKTPTDFIDQLGISHRLVSAATGTCARKELFLSSLTVPVICLYHQKHQVLIISCAQTQHCLLIIGGRQKKTQEHTVLLVRCILTICLFILEELHSIQMKGISRFSGNFLISGKILRPVMWERQYLQSPPCLLRCGV